MKLNPTQSLAWIKRRRSVFPKEFEQEEVSPDEIGALLEAARWAPTHKVTEPWRFIVFRKDALASLARVQGEAVVEQSGQNERTDMKVAKFISLANQASAVVAVVMKRDELMRIPQHEEEWATAMAVQNIYAHAVSLDIGMYWSTGAATGLPKVLEHLGISSPDRHMGWLYLGRYSQEKKLFKERKTPDDYVEWR